MRRTGWHLAVGLIAVAGCAHRPHLTAPAPGGSIEYWLGGVGTPTIVLEASVGDGFTTWDPVLDPFAAIATTVAYSRGGYGDSEIENEDTLSLRTGTDVAVNLRAMLARVGASPPFILVGHSIGGLYMLRFVGLYRDEVAGLLLLDSRLPAFPRACEAARVPPCNPTPAMIVQVPSHVRAELLGLTATEDSAPSIAELGDLPVTIIASEFSDLEELRLGHGVLVRVQRDFASSLPRGRFLVAEGSGHYVHHDRPDLVLAEVRRLVATATPADDAPRPDRF